MKIIITEQQLDALKKRRTVMVYYNLHLKTFSIMYQNKVIAHADYVRLEDVEFRVRPGGREKVRDEKRKNVHAFVIGDLVDYCEHPCNDIPEPSGIVVTYDPYKYDTFVIKDTKKPVRNAETVEMVNLKDKIYIVQK